ncbi:MAG: hypothetical protein G01um101429_692 [Parcubacteria group bacterium Gr01-1014_29]|nr:MAG: hypothetical protein G01um101429_692 [Parcubacteria group bacterium Gr01-1014_29]
MQQKHLLGACEGGDRWELGCGNCRVAVLVRLGLLVTVSQEVELLPEGFWPVPSPNGGNSHWRSELDPARLDFLRQIGATPIPNTRLFHGRRYEGWIALAVSGKPLGFAECVQKDNALYIFDTAQPAWLDAATMTKWEIRENHPTELVERIEHRGCWQQRVLDLLARL